MNIRLSGLIGALLFATSSWAQVSGRLSGTVTDPTGQVIVAADVTITNTGTSERRVVQSNEAGNFVFAALPPSTYTLMVQSEGFQAYEQTSIVINANQALALGNVSLAIGAVTETVTVQAEGAAVETDTAGVNAMLTSNQMEGLMQRGRDIVALLTVLPGVSQTAGSDALGGNWGTRTPNFSGARAGWNNFMLDGMPGNDIDATASFHVSVSMDAIQEVSVKMTAYQAEYGRSPGGQVNIISKSGTNEFHGSAYWFKRNEALNANSFDNNRFGSPKPPYRFDTFGGVLGGPVQKDKLFFFVSNEGWRIQKPTQRHRATVPTALERRGDFSQSVEQNGTLIPVLDHMTGNQFPNNMIPATRINRNGQGLLNFMPDVTDQGLYATQGINYTELSPSAHPKTQWQFKFDWVPTPDDRITFRPRFWNADIQAQRESVAFNAFNNSIFVQQHHYEYINKNLQGIYNKTISPTLVNEFRLGLGLSRESGALNDDFQLTNLRKENNPGLEDLGQLFPSANPLGLIPRFNFGGIPNGPASDYDPRTPIAAHDERVVLSNNVSWFKGNHTVKVGFYWELNDASEGPRANGVGRHMGTFDFRRTNLNPYDSNHPFANAILGNFFEYSESSGQTEGLARTYTVEWFAQDTWKVTPKFTLDVGVRFSSFTPWRLRENEGSALAIGRINVADIPSLYYPTIDPSGNRVAFDPMTGQRFPAPYIGANIPNRGNRLNGVIIGDGKDDYLHGYRERPPLQVQPRLGFAYDPFGKGTTAVRGSLRGADAVHFRLTGVDVGRDDIAADPRDPDDLLRKLGYVPQRRPGLLPAKHEGLRSRVRSAADLPVELRRAAGHWRWDGGGRQLRREQRSEPLPDPQPQYPPARDAVRRDVPRPDYGPSAARRVHASVLRLPGHQPAGEHRLFQLQRVAGQREPALHFGLPVRHRIHMVKGHGPRQRRPGRAAHLPERAGVPVRQDRL